MFKDREWDDRFKSEFKRLIGRFPNRAEYEEADRRRGLYTIREIIDMVTKNNLPLP